MFGWIVFLLNYAFDLLNMLIVIRIILSWIPHDRTNRLLRVIYALTDPLSTPLQRRMVYGSLALSPIVVLIIVGFVRTIVLGSLSSFCWRAIPRPLTESCYPYSCNRVHQRTRSSVRTEIRSK